MVNIYDFICSNATYFDQLKFGSGQEIFIDYVCPIKENQARVWSHKNCLMYIIQGSKGYGSGDYYHESREREVLFIRKGGHVLHQRFEKPYRALIFMFEDSAVRQFVSDYPDLLVGKTTSQIDFMRQPVVLGLPSTSLVESIFTSSLGYLKDPAPENAVSLKLKFRELMVGLLRMKESNYFSSYLSWIQNDASVSFIKLMRENSHCNFTVGQLARVAGMSPSSFKRIFYQNFGLPPGRWLDEQRISHAINMLEHSGKTVADIAFELGYNDSSAFAKALKRATGKAPRDFRKQQLADPK